MNKFKVLTILNYFLGKRKNRHHFRFLSNEVCYVDLVNNLEYNEKDWSSVFNITAKHRFPSIGRFFVPFVTALLIIYRYTLIHTEPNKLRC